MLVPFKSTQPVHQTICSTLSPNLFKQLKDLPSHYQALLIKFIFILFQQSYQTINNSTGQISLTSNYQNILIFYSLCVMTVTLNLVFLIEVGLNLMLLLYRHLIIFYDVRIFFIFYLYLDSFNIIRYTLLFFVIYNFKRFYINT